jgi:hypothetical protein
MAIAFKCPNCQQPYKVKDDMAGKKVVCTSCKKPIRVPAPVATPAVSSADADALAVAALSEAPVAPAEEAAATITVECPNCMEEVTFPGEKAGKQAPCPSCKRIVKVPIPATGKKDWRTADARPTFAKVAPQADLKDVVSTANMKIVDREALAEAGALRKREREPLPLRTKVNRIIIGVCVVGLVTIAGLILRGRQTVQRRGNLLATAMKLVKENPALPGSVRAETFRGVAEYVLAEPDSKPEATRRDDRATAAETARDQLANARAALTDANATAYPFERVALLTRIAQTQTGLVGDATQVRAGTRLEWIPALQEFRRTLTAFDETGQWEGTILAIRSLTRSLGLNGPNNQQAILNLIRGRFSTPDEKNDALATVGLELFSAGEAGKAKAKEIAEQLRSGPEAARQTRVVALLAATGVSDPAATESPSLEVRVGAAEGFARRGDLEAARTIARKPGSPEERFQALVAIAAVQAADLDLSDAVKLFAEEFKGRDLPEWPLIQLAQVCAQAKTPEAAKALTAALAELSNPSQRSQAVRAWAQMELLQSVVNPTEATVKAIGPESAAGHWLAWEILARRTTPSSVESWPAPARPLGLVGSALGSIGR